MREEQYINVVKIERLVPDVKHTKVQTYGSSKPRFAKPVTYHLADGQALQKLITSEKLKDLERYIDRAIQNVSGRRVIVENGSITVEQVTLSLL